MAGALLRSALSFYMIGREATPHSIRHNRSIRPLGKLIFPRTPVTHVMFKLSGVGYTHSKDQNIFVMFDFTLFQHSN